MRRAWARWWTATAGLLAGGLVSLLVQLIWSLRPFPTFAAAGAGLAVCVGLLTLGLIVLLLRLAALRRMEERLAEQVDKLSVVRETLDRTATQLRHLFQPGPLSEPAGPGAEQPTKPTKPKMDQPPPLHSDLRNDRSAPPLDLREDRRGGAAFAALNSEDPHLERNDVALVGKALVDPERLVEVWEDYLQRGDGRFNVEGLRKWLETAGIDGDVVSDSRLGDGVLGVALADGKVYLLPHFDRTPAAVAEQFLQRGNSARMARIQRLVRVAVAHRAENGGIELESKGVVE